MPAARCVEGKDRVPDPNDPIYLLDGHCPSCRARKLALRDVDEDGDEVPEPTDDYDVPTDPE